MLNLVPSYSWRMLSLNVLNDPSCVQLHLRNLHPLALEQRLRIGEILRRLLGADEDLPALLVLALRITTLGSGTLNVIIGHSLTV